MLGLPSAPGVLGGALLAIGLAVAAAAGYHFRDRVGRDLVSRVLLGVFALTLGVGPFLAWRIVEDLRYTTALDAFERDGAGPIQAFLQPYLLDTARTLIPPQDRYAAVAGSGVSNDTARQAFPSLALDRLFPRISVADPTRADWVVAWGVDPRRVVRVHDVVDATPPSGADPPLYVARVRR
jgi:hypothetical protein